MEKYENFTEFDKIFHKEEKEYSQRGQELNTLKIVRTNLEGKQTAHIIEIAKYAMNKVSIDKQFENCARPETKAENINDLNASINELQTAINDYNKNKNIVSGIEYYGEEEKEMSKILLDSINATVKDLESTVSVANDVLSGKIISFEEKVESKNENDNVIPFPEFEEVKFESPAEEKVVETQEINREDFNLDDYAEEFTIQEFKMDSLFDEDGKEKVENDSQSEENTVEVIDIDKAEEEKKAKESKMVNFEDYFKENEKESNVVNFEDYANSKKEDEDSLEDEFNKFFGDSINNNQQNADDLRKTLDELKVVDEAKTVEENEIKIDNDSKPSIDPAAIKVIAVESFIRKQSNDEEQKIEENNNSNEYSFEDGSNTLDNEVKVYGRKAA